MGKLLAIDFYKIFRTKFFYIISLILVALDALSSVTSTLVSLRNYETFNTHVFKSGAWIVTYTNFSNVCLLLAILTVLFLCSEFSHGTMKNIATKGFPREFIYLSKFFVGIFCSAVYVMLTLVTSLISILIVGGNKLPHYFDFPPNMFLTLLFTFFFLAVYVSMPLMIASLVRKSGNSLAVYVIVSTVVSLLPSLIDDFIKNTFKSNFSVAKYIYSECFGDVIQKGLVATISAGDVTRYLCVGLFFIALTLGVGIYYFRERDI